MRLFSFLQSGEPGVVSKEFGTAHTVDRSGVRTMSITPVAHDMVARDKIQEPWCNQRLPTNDHQLLYGGMRETSSVQHGVSRIALAPPTIRWRPRSGTGYAVWVANLKDRIATNDLLDTSAAPPPGLEHMAVAYPGATNGQLCDLLLVALSEYRDENTALFHLVMMTVDFSGIREESDIDYITRNFHSGPHRDGRGFLAWCHSFADHSDVGEQDRLQVKLANFKLTGNDFSLVQIEKHCVDLFSVWKKVAGNDVTAPSSYNARLLSSIPTGAGQLGSLRSWLADKITDQASFLSDPDKTIDKLIAHARTLGFRETGTSGALGGEMINFIRRKGSCKLCDSNMCDGKDKDGCFGFNKAKPFPATFAPRNRDFVEVQRKYVELFKPATLKNIRHDEMKAAIAKATGQTGAVNAAVISDANAFNAWLSLIHI